MVPRPLALRLAPLVALARAADAGACSPDFTVTCNSAWIITTDTVSSANSYPACYNSTSYNGSEGVLGFTAPAGQHVVVKTFDQQSNTDIDLFVQGDDCASNSTCIGYSNLTKQPDRVEFVSDGGNYYFTVDDYNDKVGYDFKVVVGCETTCDVSKHVQSNITCSTDVAGSTTSSTSDALDFYECGNPYPDTLQTNPETIYAFVPQATGSVTFTLSGMTSDQDLYVLESLCDPNKCVSSSNASSTATDSVTFNATKGLTYYIVVESFAGPSTFNLGFTDGAGGCHEDCNDTIDNDKDSFVDCADSDCAADPVCTCKTTDYYPDTDKDGYGNASAAATPSCTPLAGYVANKTDCDDSAASISPVGVEVCNGKDDDCDAVIDDGVLLTFYADVDLDTYGTTKATKQACSAPSGYVADNKDCDDAAKAINPAALEVCNSVDDDCDGSTDEGVQTTYYLDFDVDTYGLLTSTKSGCSAPSGYVSKAGDCVDTNKAINPGATEVCNGVDDDCDALVDDKDAVSGAPTWYADADVDKYGNTGASKAACIQPSGYVADNKDCNDAAATINPAATEVCNGVDDNCNSLIDDGIVTKVWYQDSDTDSFGGATTKSACAAPVGYVGTSGDCNDGNKAVFPGAVEVCNTIDDDCDAAIDEGVQLTFYADTDADKYGNPASTKAACAAPVGYVASNTDCDDTRATTFPGAPETCNSRDDDCDTLVDDSPTDGKTWYVDADKDAHGGTTSSLACVQPAGSVASNDDCNDKDSTVHPGATEICDGLDNDCNTLIDDNATGTGTWWPDADGDKYGSSTGVSKAQCSLPAGYVNNNRDCNDTKAAINPLATEVCDAIDNDCDALIDDKDTVTGAPSWYADSDKDTYGNAKSFTSACVQPMGSVATATDCDDTKAAVHPTAVEVCNGYDDNCDASIDEAVTTTWYLDADKDTYGWGSTSTQACTQPAGYVAGKSDCDDKDSAIHPGAGERCNGLDDDCDTKIDDADLDSPPSDALVWYQDTDVDTFGNDKSTLLRCSAPLGYADVGGDCVDTNKMINPAALEVCNLIDDDCDTVVDDNATDAKAWYADADADKYGNPASTKASCAAPSGYVADKTDCVDTNVAIHPGATEKCNGLDDDCDALVDEADAVDAVTWFDDDDKDLYGDAKDTTKACAQPAGYVGDNKDCDDQRAATNPAAPEVCNSFDDDCDGVIDEPGATGSTTWYADTDKDSYGDAKSSVLECTQRAGYLADGTDCDDKSGAVHPGATEIAYDGIDQDCDGADLADVDGDGVQSVIVGGTDCDDTEAATHPLAVEIADGVDNDCDGRVDEGTAWYDDDGDGFTEAGGDCDDSDRTAAPNATETCNGIDDDCDGTIDEGTECYDDDGDCACEDVDADRCSGSIAVCATLTGSDCADGDPDVNPLHAEVPDNGIDDDCDGSVDTGAYDPDGDGYTEEGGDCDNNDAHQYPGAPEGPDGVDNDCDGLFDEGTSAYDDDGDGFSENFGDCDDTNPDVNTDADEVPDNGIDDDCDGQIDEGGPSTDDDGDGFSEDGGDCDDFDDTVNPAATEVENGFDDNCDGRVDEGFTDKDGDGYTSDDCDDTDGWANPGTPEFCGDGVDNDCNGEIDDACDTADPTFEPEHPCGCTTGGAFGGLLPLIGLLAGVLRRSRRPNAP